ncbi:MAG: peptidoglycan editing factor PgeF [Bacteroidales bacterium]|nr:peptidoglycan editing factor PgeF [Bacteroidales bacterium]
MLRKQLQGINIRQFELLSGLKPVFHFVTDRHGGVSEGSYASLNLSHKVNDLPGNVCANRKLLAKNLGIEETMFYFPDQCHTATVKEVNHETTDLDLVSADSLITNTMGKVICVTTADCLPILLFDPVKNACGVVHAGWRGLAEKIILYAIYAMKRNYGCLPCDIIACIGPAISAARYEVGTDVPEKIADNNATKGAIRSIPRKKDKVLLDLRRIACNQLIYAGVDVNKTEISDCCTFMQNSDFYSARKEGFHTGRFCTGIMLL